MRTLILAILGLSQAGYSASRETPLPSRWQAVAREVFRELVEIDTTHENGTTAAAQAIARRLRAGGFADADLALAGPLPHKQNLVVRLRGTGAVKPVLWIVHLDVVAARREDWSVDPFAFLEKDGYFYGRGTSDMKADAAALVTGLLRLRAEGYVPSRDVIVAFTDDEESHEETDGAAWLLGNRPELVAASLVINPDAGQGEIRKGRRVILEFETSEKVFLSVRLEATDRGGHSSVPHAGNPILRLAAALGRIGSYEFPVRLSETTRGYFAAMSTMETGPLAADLAALGREPLDPAAAARVARTSDTFAALMRTTCVPTELTGGHAENALPQMARATVNCRLLPCDPPDEVEATLRRLVGDPDVSLARLDLPARGAPAPLDARVMNSVTRVMEGMFPGVRLVPTLQTGASDSRFYLAAGIPAYGVSGLFLDIDDVRAHGRDERVGVLDFFDDVEFTYRLVRELTDRDG